MQNVELSQVTAICAVVVSPLVAYVIGRLATTTQITVADRQIRASSRQVWIDALREDMASFLSLIAELSVQPNRVDELLPQILLVEMRVDLRLNVAKEQHEKLSQAMKAAAVHASKSDGESGDTLAQDAMTLRILGRVILKEAWEQVEEGQ